MVLQQQTEALEAAKLAEAEAASLSRRLEQVLAASTNSELVDELARLVGGVLMCRRREFRALAPR